MESKQTLRFKSTSLENLTPELVAKSMWVSTALAIIFSLPPVGIFIALYQAGTDLALAAGIGFGLHFAILAFSRRISECLSNLLD